MPMTQRYRTRYAKDPTAVRRRAALLPGDLRLLELIGWYRFLTLRLVLLREWRHPKAVARRLRALWDWHLVHRAFVGRDPLEAGGLPIHQPGQGSPTAVYSLAPAGVRELRKQGVAYPATRAYRAPSPNFLWHSLGVSRLQVALDRALAWAEGEGLGYRLDRFDRDKDARHLLARVEVGPKPGAASRKPVEVGLLADVYVELTYGQDERGEDSVLYLVEFDRGTESLEAFDAKCRGYWRLNAIEHDKARALFGDPGFQVLWLTESAARRERLRARLLALAALQREDPRSRREAITEHNGVFYFLALSDLALEHPPATVAGETRRCPACGGRFRADKAGERAGHLHLERLFTELLLRNTRGEPRWFIPPKS